MVLALSGQGAGLRAKYGYEHFDARGSEYSFQEHEFEVGLDVGLPFGLGLALSGSWAYRPFRHRTTFPDSNVPGGVEYGLDRRNRRERLVQARVSLARSLSKNVSVSATYHYSKNRSTADVFDYDRGIVGAYVIMEFGG